MPPQLERHYTAGFEAFCDIVCAKSGKKLFSFPHAMKTHSSTLKLKHIQQNCVSDIPLIQYYILSNEDKDRLILYK